MADGKSYLAQIKDELRDAIEEIRSADEDLDTDQICNRIWTKVVEPALKSSYANGRKAGGGSDTPRKSNWRK